MLLLLLLLRACACTPVGERARVCVCVHTEDRHTRARAHAPHHHSLLKEYLVVNTEQQGDKMRRREKKLREKVFEESWNLLRKKRAEEHAAGHETIVKWDPEWSFTPNNNNNQKHKPESQTVAGTHLAVAESVPSSSSRAHHSSLSALLFYHHNKQREREREGEKLFSSLDPLARFLSHSFPFSVRVTRIHTV